MTRKSLSEEMTIRSRHKGGRKRILDSAVGEESALFVRGN